MSATVLDFYADWCGPCKTQSPILEELANDRDDINVIEIDVEADDPEYDPNQFNVRSLPTVVVLDEDENPRKQFTGVTQQEEIEQVVDNF